jgi:hypothetical protein
MNRRAVLALAVLALAAPSVARPAAGSRAAAPGDGAEKQRLDTKAMIERNKRCMRAASAQAAKVTFDRKDVEKYLAEWRSFQALDVGKGWDVDAEGRECLELDAAIADPKYVAWARQRGLDPKTWAAKSLRITLTHAKRRAPGQAAETKAQMESQRRELTKHCKSMGPDACRDLERAFADSEQMMREGEAMMALLPDPTGAEAALLAEYEPRLREALEGRQRRHGRGGAGEPGAEDAPEEGDDEPSR